MCETADQLLYVLSDRGEMRWESFKNVFSTMLQRWSSSQANALVSDMSPKWSLFNCARALESLGHCDFDFTHANSVFIAPPILARLPRAGTPIAVLTGARTPAMVERLLHCASENSIKVTAMRPTGTVFGVPTCIRLEAFSPSKFQTLSTEVGIQFLCEPPAWNLGCFSASVNDYIESLEWLPATEPDWSEAGYSPIALNFTGLPDLDAQMRLSRNESHGRWQHALWQRGERATADLNWARYVVAHDQSQQLVAYDARTFVFAVPVAAPVPNPLSRALGLCSGRTPRRAACPSVPVNVRENRRVFDLFDDVPPQVAELVAAKLGQQVLAAGFERRGD